MEHPVHGGLVYSNRDDRSAGEIFLMSSLDQLLTNFVLLLLNVCFNILLNNAQVTPAINNVHCSRQVLHN